MDPVEPQASSALPWLRRLALAAFVFGLLFTLQAAWQQDATYDEPYHLEWARRLLHERVTERRTSPLWNSKTPVMMAHVAAQDAGRALGATERRALVFWSRLPGIVCYAGVLALVYVFARRRLSEEAALVAVLGLALEPNLIANAAVATVDAPYTLATLVTLAAGVRLAEEATGARAIVLGLALGFAFVTKFTAFLLVPCLALLPLCYGVRQLGGWRRIALLACLVTVGAIVLVDVAYLATGLLLPVGRIRWKSDVMTHAAAWLPRLRLPLPADFLTGFDICLFHERKRVWMVLILDHLYRGGVWWYFLVSWLLKTPALLLAAEVLGLLRLVRMPGAAPLRRFLGLNLAVALLYFSFLFRAQIGYRYVLMCLPLVALLAAEGLANAAPRRLVWGAAAVTLASLVELAPYAGNVLAYSSPIVQPKTRAFRFLTNSSIDWGQNDAQVRDWLDAERERRPSEPIAFNPAHIRPGLNVIDLNALAGGTSYDQHRWLRTHRNPEGHFRHTYLLFTIDAPAYDRFLNDDRRLSPRPGDSSACRAEDPARSVTPETWRRFPNLPARANAWIACVVTDVETDVALVASRGGLIMGRTGTQMRDWDRLREGEEIVYRLEPGTHALAAMKTTGFKGRFEVRRGAATISLRPAAIKKGGRVDVRRTAGD